MLANLILIS